MTDLTKPSEFMALLELQFDEVGPTRVSGSVAADERHHQPWGLVHGGLYTTAIETFATTGAYAAVKDRPAERDRERDPPGAYPAALAGRDPPARGRQARRARPGPPPEHRAMSGRQSALDTTRGDPR